MASFPKNRNWPIPAKKVKIHLFALFIFEKGMNKKKEGETSAWHNVTTRYDQVFIRLKFIFRFKAMVRKKTKQKK